MTEALTPFEQEVESMARAVVDANQPMLNALGIRADYHGVIVRTATVGSRVSEVEISTGWSSSSSATGVRPPQSMKCGNGLAMSSAILSGVSGCKGIQCELADMKRCPHSREPQLVGRITRDTRSLAPAKPYDLRPAPHGRT
jgi:hypothetical protein